MNIEEIDEETRKAITNSICASFTQKTRKIKRQDLPPELKPNLVRGKIQQQYANIYLLEQVYQNCSLPKDVCKNVINTLWMVMRQALGAGIPLRVQRLGRFVIRVRKARTIPAGGYRKRTIHMPDSYYIKFIMSPWLRKAMRRLDKPEVSHQNKSDGTSPAAELQA